MPRLSRLAAKRSKSLLCLSLLGLVLASAVEAQVLNIATLAGGAKTAGSADGTAINARFDDPWGIAVDAGGTLYVADQVNDTIRKITPTGVVTTLAGSPGLAGYVDGNVTAARFNQPAGIAVDSAGNLYVADYGNAAVRKISTAGMVTTVAGPAAGFVNPSGITVDPAGNVYVTDNSNPTVKKIAPGGGVTILAGSAAAGYADGTGSAALFNDPNGIVIDSAGNLYVADSLNRVIRMVSPTGVVTTLAGVPGSRPYPIDGTGPSAQFSAPNCLAIDSNRNLYLTDGNTLRKITPGGIVTTLAGVDSLPDYLDGSGTAAHFYIPAGIAVDSSGNLFVADRFNDVIRTSEALIPMVINQPAAQSVPAGSSVTLTVGAIGSPILSYQWFLNGSPLNSSSPYNYLKVTNLSATTAGSYTVVVANQLGAVTSAAAVVTVNPTPVLASTPWANGSFGSAFYYQVSMTGTPFSYSAGGLPPGLTLNSATGVISGVPTQVGTFNASVNATNFIGAGVYYPLTLTIAGPAFTLASVATLPSSVLGQLAQDSLGNYYVANPGGSTVTEIQPGGQSILLGGGYAAPQGVAVDLAGNVYVADTGNQVIKKLAAGPGGPGTGTVATLAGSAGQSGSADGTGTAALFNGPTGIAVDSFGNLYVSDSGNSTIRKIAPTGAVITLAGLAGQSGRVDAFGIGARFNHPTGIAVDLAGNLYVLDNGNGAVRTITPAGSVATLSSGFGGGLLHLERFLGIAVDSARNVYAASGPQESPVGGQTQSVSAFYLISPSGAATVLYRWSSYGFPGTNDPTPTDVYITGVAVDSSGTPYALIGNALTRFNLATAPAIAAQPVSLTVNAGAPGSFSVTASGAALTYQWQKNGAVIPGATGSIYFVLSVASGDAGNYSVVVTNNGNASVVSRTVTLGVNQSPGSSYLSAWSARSLPSTALLTAVAYDGADFLAVGTDGSVWTSATGANWSAAAAGAGGRLNSLISVGSGPGLIGVGDGGRIVWFAGPGYAPAVQVSNPAALLTGIALGGGRMVAVGFVGTVLSSVQNFTAPNWQAAPPPTGFNLNAVAFGNGVFAAVGDQGTIVISSAGTQWTTVNSGTTAALYSVAASPAGFVAVGAGGTILTSPDGINWIPQVSPTTNDLIRLAYQNNVFIAAGGAGAVVTSTDGGVTWTAQPSGTAQTLEGVTFGAGSFVAVGQNGTVIESTAAAVHLANLSARSWVSSVGGGLTAGFVTAGGAASPGKNILIRGVGPALAGFGVSTPLAAPQLTLYNGASVPISFNAGWGGSAALSNSFAQVYAFPYPSNSADAALLQMLANGSYSAAVSANTGQGVALAEIYDADTPPSGGRLINLSARAVVGSGLNVLVAGFVVSGNEGERVLIRGVGPGLAQFGVPGTLATPVLTVYDAAGNILASNSGWGGAAALASAFVQVGAFSLLANSLDCALILALPAGNYSAQVAPQAAGQTGNAMVEIYELP